MKTYNTNHYLPLLLISSLLLTCKVSLTRITPIDSVGLPSIRTAVNKIIKKDKDSFRLDLTCGEGVNFSNYKSLVGDLSSINSFQLEDNARVQLRIKFPEPPNTYKFLTTYTLSFLTLGIFPSLDQTSMKARIDLYDKKEKVILKSFAYEIKKREYRGWSTPAIAAFVTAGSTVGVYQDLDTTGRGTPILEPMARKLADDIKLELDDPKLYSALTSTEKYPLSASIVISEEDNKVLSIKEGLEKRLSQLGVTIVNKNPETQRVIYQIFADEQRGLYNVGPKAGQLSQITTVFKISLKQDRDKTTVNAELIDVESGNILNKLSKDRTPNSEYSMEILLDDLALELAAAKKTK